MVASKTVLNSYQINNSALLIDIHLISMSATQESGRRNREILNELDEDEREGQEMALFF